MSVEEYEGYDSESRIRLVNFSRVLMYSTAAWIQIPLASNDLMIVLVPVFLGCWDFVMGIWSINPSTRFWNMSFIIPLISTIVAMNTILHLWYSLTLSVFGAIMFWLSIGVILVSLVEIRTLAITVRIWNWKLDRNTSIDEIRTYEV